MRQAKEKIDLQIAKMNHYAQGIAAAYKADSGALVRGLVDATLSAVIGILQWCLSVVLETGHIGRIADLGRQAAEARLPDPIPIIMGAKEGDDKDEKN